MKRIFSTAFAFLLITLAGCGSSSTGSVDVEPVVLAAVPTVAPTVESVPTVVPMPVATPMPTAKPTAKRKPQARALAPVASQSLEEAFPVQEAAPSKRRSGSESSRPRTSQSSTPRTERARREPQSKANVEQGGQVWVNSNSDVYHMPGMRWYGNTKEGYYTTEEKAKAEGYRRAMR